MYGEEMPVLKSLPQRPESAIVLHPGKVKMEEGWKGAGGRSRQREQCEASACLRVNCLDKNPSSYNYVEVHHGILSIFSLSLPWHNFQISSYVSVVLVEKEGAVCNCGFPDTSYKTFFFFDSAASFFASSFGIGEKCLVPVFHFSIRILGNIVRVERVSYEVCTRRHQVLSLSSVLWAYVVIQKGL